MEPNRSLYKSVLLDIVSWESRERRENILRKVPRAVAFVGIVCLTLLEYAVFGCYVGVVITPYNRCVSM